MESPLVGPAAPTIDDGRIRVLHVDDDPAFIETTAAWLERDGAFDLVGETSAETALERLDRESFDCVVSDYEMPEMDGLELLDAVRDRFDDLPFVLFTGRGSEAVASRAVSAGVSAYVRKRVGSEQYELLATRITHLVERRRARRALVESQRRFETLVRNLPGMVYRCHNERGWPMAYVSEGCRALTGYAPERVVDGDPSYGDIIHPADCEAVWDRVQSAVAAGEPFRVKYRIVTADGDRREVWEQGRAVDEAGTTLEGFITRARGHSVGED